MKYINKNLIVDLLSLFLIGFIFVSLGIFTYKGVKKDFEIARIQDNDLIILTNDEYCKKYYSNLRVNYLPVKCLSVFK